MYNRTDEQIVLACRMDDATKRSFIVVLRRDGCSMVRIEFLMNEKDDVDQEHP